MDRNHYRALLFLVIFCISFAQVAEAAGCQALSSSTLQHKAKHYKESIVSASKKYGVNPDLIAAVITIESCFRRKARGTSGEKGLMQLMPGTARLVGVKQRYNAWENIHGGTRYLSYLLSYYQGNHERAIAAYNAGQGNVGKKGRIRNIQYVKKVMRAYGKLSKGKASKLAFKTVKRYLPSSLRQSRSRSLSQNATKTPSKAVLSQTDSNKQIKQSARVAAANPVNITNKVVRPTGNSHYRVKKGDTVYAVMRNTGVHVKQVMQLNHLKPPYTLIPGQLLRLR